MADRNIISPDLVQEAALGTPTFEIVIHPLNQAVHVGNNLAVTGGDTSCCVADNDALTHPAGLVHPTTTLYFCYRLLECSTFEQLRLSVVSITDLRPFRTRHFT